MLDPDDDKNVIIKTGALIRHTFGINPYSVSESEFVRLAAEALFVQDFKRKQLEEANLQAFSQLFTLLNK